MNKIIQTSILAQSVSLSETIDGWISTEEMHFLAMWTMYTALMERNVLEIGSYKGKATVAMALILKLLASKQQIFAIDPGTGVWVGNDDFSFGVLQSNVAKLKLNNWILTLRCDADLGGVELDEVVGMAFIDGAHGIKDVRRDFHFASGRLIEGGLMLFHDDHQDCFPEVWLHCRQVSARYGYLYLGQVGSLSAFRKPITLK